MQLPWGMIIIKMYCCFLLCGPHSAVCTPVLQSILFFPSQPPTPLSSVLIHLLSLPTFPLSRLEEQAVCSAVCSLCWIFLSPFFTLWLEVQSKPVCLWLEVQPEPVNGLRKTVRANLFCSVCSLCWIFLSPCFSRCGLSKSKPLCLWLEQVQACLCVAWGKQSKPQVQSVLLCLFSLLNSPLWLFFTLYFTLWQT